ncbi:MAG: tetratricopeptide repeat protein [Thermoguttaceae bacterium]|nr:tetratricopeptide repeat protein [Thermoguttaceae bacterium]MDW8038654.1 tetratricopeptide repeat protein [Thermoguttaceae bacterium]
MKAWCGSRYWVGLIGAALFGGAISTLWGEPVPVGEVPPVVEPPQQIQEVQDAVTRFRNGDIDGARALLVAATKKHTDLPPADVIMAQLFASVGQLDQAIRSLESALKESPNDPEAFVILADLEFRGGRTTAAKFLYSQAEQLLKDFKGTARRKRLILQRMCSGMAGLAEVAEDWPTAQKYLETWLKEDPDNVNALHRLARALFQQNKTDEALEKLRAAKKANDQVLTPEATMAQFYESAGQREQAAKMMVAALTAEPKNLQTRLAAAQWAFDTEQYDQAKAQVEIALKLDPESFQAKMLAGLVAYFMKDYKTAEKYFESAHVQSPGNFAALNNWALALTEQDEEAKKRKALEVAQIAVQAFGNVAEAWSTYGWVLYRLGRLNEADQALGRAAATGQLSPDTAFYIARVMVDRGQTDRAKELLKQALQTKRPFSKRQEAEALLKGLR